MPSHIITEYLRNASLFIAKLWAAFMHGFVRHRLLWVLLWAVSMLSIADIPAGIAFHMSPIIQVIYIICVGAFKGCVLLAIFVLCFSHKWLKIIACVALVMYTAIALVNSAAYHFFGFGITRRMISIIMQTNPAEATEFARYAASLAASTILSWKFPASVAATVVIVTLIRRIPNKIFTCSSLALSAAGLLMAIIFAASFTSGRTAHVLSLRIVKYGCETYKDLREFERLKSTLSPLPDQDSVSSTHRAATVTVVIGESASRRHWQAYGYTLPTTPNVSAMADSLFILADVIGSSTSTSLNLENILTLKNDSIPEGTALHYPRVIDIFNKAGYTTYWLSNQERTGLVSNMSGVLVSNADVIRYIGAESSEDALIAKYDEELLPHLREAMTDTSTHKLIFLHLLGSHIVYTSRYPHSAAYFTGDDIKMQPGRASLSDDEASTVAEYDNSLRYTDSLLGEILRATAKLTEPALLIYISDHGVNVYDSDGIHGRGERYVEVPAIIYANAAYRSANPDIISALGQSLKLPVTTADLPQPLMTLTGTHYSGYDSSRDFLSPDYVRRHRYVDTRPWKFGR